MMSSVTTVDMEVLMYKLLGVSRAQILDGTRSTLAYYHTRLAHLGPVRRWMRMFLDKLGGESYG